MNYTAEEIQNILLDNDYPASNKQLLESVIRQIQKLTPEAKDAFEIWCDTRNLPSFDIDGVTVDFLKTHHRMTDIAVILAYDGLIRNPRSAYLLKKPVIMHTI